MTRSGEAWILRKLPVSMPSERRFYEDSKDTGADGYVRTVFVGVRYALEMARELSAEVIVYHVVPMGEDWFVGLREAWPSA